MSDQNTNNAAEPPMGGIAAMAMQARNAASMPNSMVSYTQGLNPEQQDAVETTEGPLLVLAGAGTGKTRVLVSRIAHIMGGKRAFPSQILAVTFTNKAAREMRERIEGYVGDQIEGMPWLGTFHSICVKILRQHAELVGLKSGFSILDTDDQIRLIKQLLQAEGIDEKRWPARQFAALMDGWKNKAQTPERISAGDASYFANGKARELYASYQGRLKAINACDFGDLLLECIRLFQQNPDVLAEFHRRFRYILVDEYQDTNVAQYLWLRLLAMRPEEEKPNICCVGDDDQSIYGWRGAEVDNILRFEKDFPSAKVIRLERNYRSTEHILGAAAHLITHNEGRLGKTLFTEIKTPDAEKVRITAGWDSEEEARTIGDEIESLQTKGHMLNDMAILVRASFQMREFEDRFVTLGLNYRVIGGPRFYERQEIRDAMAYLKVMSQPANDLAFERIVNKPKRGLGDATIKIIRDLSRARQIPMLAAVGELIETEELKPKQRHTLKTLYLNFQRWADLIDNIPHTELTEQVLEESGYTEMWQNDKSADAPGRLDNLKELVRSMEEFENLRGFLEHVSLVMDAENNADQDAVNIMTLHSAKGLEFDTVFLPGWEEGLFPHQRSLDEGGRSGLEEERRLAYVGITRARKSARISFVSNRRIHGLWQSSLPSRFLEELPPEHIEVAEPGNSYGGYASAGAGGAYGASSFDNQNFATSGNYASPGWQRAKNAQSRSTNSRFSSAGSARGPQTIEGELIAKSVFTGDSSFEIGERIFHQKFGYGKITLVDGNKLTINFDKAGQKRVLDSFVEAV